MAEIVNAVLYKLKSGVQWHMLPVSELFSGEPLHYKTVFGHYRKWCRSGKHPSNCILIGIDIHV